MKKIIFLYAFFCAVVMFSSCNTQEKQKAANECSLDSINIIPFGYEPKLQRMITFKGYINDTVPLKLLFDTGWLRLPGLSHPLKNEIDTVKSISIGYQKFHVNQQAKYLAKDHFLYKWMQSDSIAIFSLYVFKDMLFELSFKDKYIRLLDSLQQIKDIDSYECIKMIYAKDVFNIPVIIDINGTCISENLLFDTGFNGSLVLNRDIQSKYNINLESALRGHTLSAATNDGVQQRTIPADTIKIGKFNLTGYYVHFNADNHIRPGGIIGNSILQKFSLIFDLKNLNLYLKPVDKLEIEWKNKELTCN